MAEAVEETPMARRSALLFAGAVLAAAVLAPAAGARLYLAPYTILQPNGASAGEIAGYGYGDAGQADDTFRVDVVRGGALIATATAQFYAVASVVPAAGDVVTITDVEAGTARATVLSGRPSLAASVCGAAATFSGLRDAGSTLRLTAALDDGSSARTNVNRVRTRTFFGDGDGFAGSFGMTLSPAWVVSLSQARSVDPGFTVFSDATRPVGACPSPDGGTRLPIRVRPLPAAPKPASPIKDTILPFAKLTPPAALSSPRAAFRALLLGTFTTRLLVSEAGTVRQTVYLDDGARLPKPTATPAAKRKAARKPTVIAQGSVTVKRPSVVTVKVKLSKKGRARLRRAKSTRLALVTVIEDQAGNVRVLPVTRFTVKRVKGVK
jgi:hypothetical protein